MQYGSENTSTGGSRVYLDTEGREYVSITTLLSKYEDKTILNNWVNRVGEEQADVVREDACERGKLAHSSIEAYFQQNTISLPLPLDSHILDNRFARVAIDTFYSKVEPIQEEGVVFGEPYPGARLAGRFDQLLHIPDKTFRFVHDNEYVKPKNVIVDLKTKVKSPRLDKLDFILKHLLQISAYATLLNSSQSFNISGGCIVYAVALKTKEVCKVLHIDKECIDFYWKHVYDMLLDYYGIQPMKKTWKDIIREAGCSYDFVSDSFVDYEPKEIY